MKLKKANWDFKLISLFLVVFSISILFQMFYITPYIRNQEIEKAKLYQNEISNNIAREVDVGLNRIKNRITRMSMLPEFRNMNIDVIKRVIFEQEKISERISNIAVMNSDGCFIYGSMSEKDSSEYIHQSYADKPYFSIPFNEGKTYLTKVRYYANENLIATSICIPIETESGDRVGVLIGRMDLRDIIKRVLEYPLEKGQRAYIVDEKGIGIAHSDIDVFAIKDGPLSLNLACLFVKEMLSGLKDGAMIHSHEGTDFYGSYVLLEYNGWGVVVEEPMKYILAKSKMQSNRILIFEIFIFLIGTFIIIIFARQITLAQKKAKKSLQYREREYRALFDNMLDSFAYHKIVLDKKNVPIDYIFIDVNDAFENQTGLKRKNIIGKKVTKVLSGIENENTRWIEIYGKVAQTGKDITFESFKKQLNKWYYINAYSIEIGYFATVISDITERKQADERIEQKSIVLEEQFKKSEEQRIATLSILSDLNTTSKDLKLEIIDHKRAVQIQKVLYNISNAVITTDNLEKLISLIQKELGTIIDTSNFYIALYDAKTNTLSLPFFSDEKDKLTFFPAGKTLTYYVIKTQKSLLATKDEIEILEKSGEVESFGTNSEVWLGVPLKVEGIVTGVIAVQSYEDENVFSQKDMEILEFVSHQISISVERKKAEQDLKEAFFKATESDRLKTAFLNTMSHELRTPLNAVIGFSDIIDEDLPMEEIVDYNKMINDSGKHLLNIIDDIFDISLIESGEIKILKNYYNLAEIFNEVNSIISIEQTKVNRPNVDYRCLTKVKDKDLLVFTDKQKFKQILINLLKNSIKFTHEGFIECDFKKEIIDNVPMLKFWVKDTGIGISEEKINIIFDVFRQADDSHTRKYDGTGIGLAVSKNFTKLLGGKIWVESEKGKGSTFYFTLPEKKPDVHQESSGSDIQKTKNKFSGKTVLVAEDDFASYTLLEILLGRMGIKTLHAKNGKESIEMSKNNAEISLVLMDVKMPDMNGYEATAQIKKIRPELLIIAQTSYALQGDNTKAMEAGCDDYIAKPIKKQKLFELIEKHLS